MTIVSSGPKPSSFPPLGGDLAPPTGEGKGNGSSTVIGLLTQYHAISAAFLHSIYDKVTLVPSECVKLPKEQIIAINRGVMLDIHGSPTAGG
jgi:hypothetical protein